MTSTMTFRPLSWRNWRKLSEDALTTEIKAHQVFGEDRANGFLGRQDAIESIMAYLSGASPRPLVVHGVSGSGKSALLAECVRQATHTFPSGTIIIPRFIGATPDSTELRNLLRGLCIQARPTARRHQACPLR